MNRAERRRDAKRDRRAAPAGQGDAGRFGRGVALFGAGDLDGAEALFRRCLQGGSNEARARHNLGVIAGRRGRHGEAAALFRSAVDLAPGDAETWMNLGLSLAEAGDLAAGRDAVERSVALAPAAPAGRTALAEILTRQADFAGALRACRAALAIDGTFGPALVRAGQLVFRAGDPQAAAAQAEAWLRLPLDAAPALLARGRALHALGRFGDAEADLRAALARGAGEEAYLALSVALVDDARVGEALAVLDRAVAALPESGLARMNRAVLHQRAGRYDAALADFTRALQLNPDDPRAYHNVGFMLQRVEQPADAIPFLEHAIRLQPDLIESFMYLAESHRDLGQYEAAVAVLEAAVERAPAQPYIRISLLWARMHACAWRGFGDSLRDDLALCIAHGETASPFIITAMGLSNLETLLWTRAWTEQHLDPAPAAIDRPGPAPAPGRIRVGYLSADFRGHATAILTVGLLEGHDRDRFEIVGYNIGRGDGSAMGRRVCAALERLVDLSGLGDREAAQRIADDGIDILIDMKGFTISARPNILSFRPAPIQVNYLGYPGTMGTHHIDYVIADPVVAPFDHAPFYAEQIVHLPHCYQPNDRDRPGADPEARRADHGLPERGFVFCCFNNTYKITPMVFEVWMRLLREVEGAVLWLFEANRLATDNLRAEAAARGVDPDRIVFAPRRLYADHMARMGLADLFLDTLPYNAHTTASDALWAGVPVLTMLGPYFPGRVAASLLRAAELPELVAPDIAAYEALALALARDPERLAALRGRLAGGRLTVPLFDTARYRDAFEAALAHMVRRQADGRPPEAFAVADDLSVSAAPRADGREGEASLAATAIEEEI